MASFPDRLIGALKLQPATFDEVERDNNATAQAAVVVIIGSIASSIWLLRLGWFGWMMRQVLTTLIAWAIGAAVIWLLGTRVIPGKNTQADFWQVLRPLGFAYAPAIFLVLAIIPVLGYLIGLIVMIWILAAAVIATRQALDYDDTAKAVIVVVLGLAAFWVLSFLTGPYPYGRWYY